MAYSTDSINPSHRFLFKPISGVENGGCAAEIWLPGTHRQSLPVAILYHGGGWLIGTADGIPFNQVRYLLEHGIAVVSFEYRYIPHASLQDIREDLVDSYRYMQQGINDDLAEAGSPYTLDGTRCSAMGWSAGGANCVYLQNDISKLDPPLPPLRSLVLTYPVMDLNIWPGLRSDMESFCKTRRRLRTGLEELEAAPPTASFLVNPSDWGLVSGAMTEDNIPMDSTPGSEEIGLDLSEEVLPARLRYAAGVFTTNCLSALLLQQDPPFPVESSPINLINSTFPPTCIIAAGQDDSIPLNDLQRASEKFQALGIQTEFYKCETMEHGQAEVLSAGDWNEEWWGGGIRQSLEFLVKLT